MDPYEPEAELKRLTLERAELDAKIAALRQTIDILGPVYADQRTEGITEHVRQVLISSNGGLAPKVVRSASKMKVLISASTAIRWR